VTTWTPNDEAALEAVCAALEPYPWRSFTPELVARFVVAASDREGLRAGLVGVPGAAVGSWERLEPTAPDDRRLEPLVEFLTSHRWTQLRLSALCRGLVSLLT
jgi:hypothetical protein